MNMINQLKEEEDFTHTKLWRCSSPLTPPSLLSSLTRCWKLAIGSWIHWIILATLTKCSPFLSVGSQLEFCGDRRGDQADLDRNWFAQGTSLSNWVHNRHENRRCLSQSRIPRWVERPKEYNRQVHRFDRIWTSWGQLHKMIIPQELSSPAKP